MNNWLQELKPGDLVLVDGNKSGFNDAPDTTTGRVLRVTKNTIVLQAGRDESAGYRFNRATGEQRTSDSFATRRRLIERTPKMLEVHNEEWRRYKMIRALKSFNYNDLHTAGLEQMFAVISRRVDLEKDNAG